MNRTFCLFAAFLLVSCGPGARDDDDDADASGCDGERNLGEFTVDDAYDADGDGFFDPDDPGCAETYDADQLDCDESDAMVNPGMDETACNDTDDDCDASTADSEDLDADGYTTCEGDCDDASQLIHPDAEDEDCNGIDEDCNGSDGEPCDIDYSGDWDLTSTVSYSCDALEIDFDSMTVNHEGDGVAVAPDGCGGCQPTNLQGDFTTDNQFAASQVVGGSGCDGHFSMLGTFTSAAAMNGSLSVNFVGADCSAKGCSGQTLSFQAVLSD